MRTNSFKKNVNSKVYNSREQLIKTFSLLDMDAVGFYVRKGGLFPQYFGIKSVTIKESKYGTKYLNIILTDSGYYGEKNNYTIGELFDFIMNNDFGKAYYRIDTERYGGDFIGWHLKSYTNNHNKKIHVDIID